MSNRPQFHNGPRQLQANIEARMKKPHKVAILMQVDDNTEAKLICTFDEKPAAAIMEGARIFIDIADYDCVTQAFNEVIVTVIPK